MIRHGEAGRQGLSWPSRPSWGFSKVLDHHALSRGLVMTSLEKASKFQDALKVFEIGISRLAGILIIAFLGKKSSTLVVELNLTMGYLFVLYPLVFSVQVVCQPLLAKLFTDKDTSLLQERFFNMSLLSMLIGCATTAAIWIMPNPFSFYPDKEIADHCFLMLKILSLSIIAEILSEGAFCLSIPRHYSLLMEKSGCSCFFHCHALCCL